MQFNAGVLGQRYPLRDTAEGAGQSRHSIRYPDSLRRLIVRLFKRHTEFLAADPDAELSGHPQARMQSSGRLEPAAMAKDFAAFAMAIDKSAGISVVPKHVESALSLVCRHVESIPVREDRVIACGLAATALARAGLGVHLVTDGEIGLTHPRQLLFPALSLLGIDAAEITGDMDSGQRRLAYGYPVVILSARECAMDFLRDAINSPGRANSSLQYAQRLAGRNAPHQQPVMRGLPCAILIDADSTLIDSARAPIVLTRDAVPLHEQAEVEKALEMAGVLQPGDHYTLTGHGAEVQLTRSGQTQLEEWCKQLGGLWQARHVAQLMLGSAITSKFLIKPGVHYQVEEKTVHWLVQKKLIPGMEVYPEALLVSMVESLEQCVVEKSPEVVARSSYQQLFNHYLHLCGASYATHHIARELHRMYGLNSRTRWPRSRPGSFQRGMLPGSDGQLENWLIDWARGHTSETCSMIVVADSDAASRIEQRFVDVVRGSLNLANASESELMSGLAPGNLIIVTVIMLDHYLPLLDADSMPPIRCVVSHRSPRIAEDNRQQFWRFGLRNSLGVSGNDCALALSDESKLFENEKANGLKSLLNLVGPRHGIRLIENRIRRIQHHRGRDLAATRQALAAHDEVMAGILAFTGEGLFKN